MDVVQPISFNWVRLHLNFDTHRINMGQFVEQILLWEYCRNMFELNYPMQSQTEESDLERCQLNVRIPLTISIMVIDSWIFIQSSERRYSLTFNIFYHFFPWYGFYVLNRVRLVLCRLLIVGRFCLIYIWSWTCDSVLSVRCTYVERMNAAVQLCTQVFEI